MTELSFSFDAVLAEISRLHSSNPDGFTMLDMRRATGRSGNWCRDRVRQMIDAGVLVCNGKASRTTIDGRPCLVPVYKVVGQ